MTIGAFNSPLFTISLNASPARCRSPSPSQQMRAGRPWNAMRSLRHVEPAVQVRVVGEELLDLAVGLVDVFGIARQARPSGTAPCLRRRAAGCTPARTRKGERVGNALVVRDLPDVVAVVERRDALPLEREHRVRRARRSIASRRPSAPRAATGSFCAAFQRSTVQPRGQIAVDEVVRGRLVGDHVRPHAAPHKLRQDLRGIAEQARPTAGASSARASSMIASASSRSLRLPVEIARGEAHLDAALLALDREHRRAGHRRRQRLRAAHAAESRGQDPADRQARRRSAGARLRRKSRRCPARCPGCRCRSTSRPSSGRTS